MSELELLQEIVKSMGDLKDGIYLLCFLVILNILF